MNENIVKIGTRGSRLALWQADFIASCLQKGGLQTEIIKIETKGDKILNTSIAKIGSKGVFTEELEEQLRNGTIDIAVHSAKDLQSELPEDLEIIAFTEREKVNDVLISLNKNVPVLLNTYTSENTTIENREEIPQLSPFIIGTSSTRRIALLKHFYPHIQTTDMRGNLQTRMQKLESGICDALLLAYAGVHRMGLEEHIVSFLPTHTFIPAVGQGSVAVECSKNLNSFKKLKIRELTNHPTTEKCLLAERSFLKALQGGCSIPVFGLATIENNEITLHGGIVSLDGKNYIHHKVKTSLLTPENAGNALAERVWEAGGLDILRQIRQSLL
jgi:hydroxymethylbilane synthase